jgi:hypothetical protein
MAARLDNGDVHLLTRTGLDWTTKYPAIAEGLAELPATTGYLDGELCGVLPDGRTAFNLIQNAADTHSGSLVFFLFDLLFLDGEDIRGLPLIERKARLKTLLADACPCLQFTDHRLGRGPAFHRLACGHGLVRLQPAKPRPGGLCAAPTGTTRCKPLQFPPELRSRQRCACVGNALVGEGKCRRWLRDDVQIAGDRDWVRACGSGARGTRLASGRFESYRVSRRPFWLSPTRRYGSPQVGHSRRPRREEGCRSLRGVLGLVVQDHPNCAGTHLRGILCFGVEN